MRDNEARRLLNDLRADPPQIPHGQALVLVMVGDDAELITALHPSTVPLRIPAARIAGQAGLPANELAGRRFTVATLTETDADGFTLLDDPRL